MPAKPDANEIAAFMKSLEKGLRRNIEFWPRYVFRSEDVESAASILNSGQLLSRAEADRRGLIKKDCASKGIINALPQEDKEWVRLYFRPRTPTQHANEGIRPVSEQRMDSHMPVPVYFLFRSGAVLSERGVSFTPGRLRPGIAIESDLKSLRSLPWKKIFHDDSFRSSERNEIVDARNAEVLVPKRLPLDHLRYVVCRTAPERDTLLSLLEPAMAEKWRKSIIVESGERVFFFKRGIHVREVVLAPDHSRFGFFTSTPSPNWLGPFALRIDWGYPDGKGAYYERDPYTVESKPLRVNLKGHYKRYSVRLTLNGDLAYQGEFIESTEPELLS